jgi:hypothetical protein
MKYIIALGILLIGYIIFSEMRNRDNIRRIDKIVERDSIATHKINIEIKRIDSLNRQLKGSDSVLALEIKRKKGDLNVIKKKYEDNSGNIPFLPEF